MGCWPSKCLEMKTDKEYVVTPEAVTVAPYTETNNQVQHGDGHAVQEMHMDRDDDMSVGNTVNDAAMTIRLPPDQATSSILLHEEVIRAPEDTTLMQTRPPKKTSHSADDIPISSTYHRAHSAEVAEQESKRQEEQQMEAEEREREIREYKAAMGLS